VTFKGLTAFSVNVRQVQVKLDRPRVFADRTPDEIDALGRTPRLMQQHAQQVQRVGILRIGIKHVSIELFGLA
jgi:hypothetical protein